MLFTLKFSSSHFRPLEGRGAKYCRLIIAILLFLTFWKKFETIQIYKIEITKFGKNENIFYLLAKI